MCFYTTYDFTTNKFQCASLMPIKGIDSKISKKKKQFEKNNLEEKKPEVQYYEQIIDSNKNSWCLCFIIGRKLIKKR